MFSKLSLRTTILQIVTTCVLLLLDNFFANFANCGSRNFFLQIIQISIQESLFANFVNCRRALDILFLQVVQLVVLDILLTNFCELLFQTIFCCEKILGLGDWVNSLTKVVRVVGVVKVVRVVGVVKVVRVLKNVEMSYLWRTDIRASESWALFSFWAEFAIANT